MSRIGKKPIELPKGVEVKQDGNAVTIKGPKGSLSTTLIPLVTAANGAKPVESRLTLSTRLTKSCVVRVPGPAVAKVTVPRTLCSVTGSSAIVASRHAADTCRSGLIPNWTTKPGTTRKNFTPSKKCDLTRL